MNVNRVYFQSIPEYLLYGAAYYQKHPFWIEIVTGFASRLIPTLFDPRGALIKRSFLKRFVTITLPDNAPSVALMWISRMPDVKALKNPEVLLVFTVLTFTTSILLDRCRWLFASLMHEVFMKPRRYVFSSQLHAKAEELAARAIWLIGPRDLHAV